MKLNGRYEPRQTQLKALAQFRLTACIFFYRKLSVSNDLFDDHSISLGSQKCPVRLAVHEIPRVCSSLWIPKWVPGRRAECQYRLVGTRHCN